MTLLGLIVLILVILWLTGQLGGAPASPPPQIIWIIIVVVLLLWFFGGEGNTAWHHGRFWHR
jgi:hypothetical protein